MRAREITFSSHSDTSKIFFNLIRTLSLSGVWEPSLLNHIHSSSFPFRIRLNCSQSQNHFVEPWNIIHNFISMTHSTKSSPPNQYKLSDEIATPCHKFVAYSNWQQPRTRTAHTIAKPCSDEKKETIQQKQKAHKRPTQQAARIEINKIALNGPVARKASLICVLICIRFPIDIMEIVRVSYLNCKYMLFFRTSWATKIAKTKNSIA